MKEGGRVTRAAGRLRAVETVKGSRKTATCVGAAECTSLASSIVADARHAHPEPTGGALGAG